jgi:isopenicillin N synthase-like dioxygenase
VSQLSVPVIDLQPRQGLSDNSDKDFRASLARSIDQALTEIGFFVVVGHGLDWSRIEATASLCREFFDLPQSAKDAVANEGVPFRGYVGYGGENLSYTENEATPPDWKENFILGRRDFNDAYFQRSEHNGTFKPNVWPASMPQLRPAMEWYSDAMEALTDRLMQGLARALDLEPLFFRDKLDHNDNTLRATNYPHQLEPPQPGQLRTGAHTDYGAITILKVEDAPGGLQVRTRDGQWVDAPIVAEGLVVNIGDLMMTWTNDRWLSNMHRVVNPGRDEQGSTRRQSMVYFVNCNPDARIECLPSCHTADNPPRHPPITAGEHRSMKLAKSVEPITTPIATPIATTTAAPISKEP